MKAAKNRKFLIFIFGLFVGIIISSIFHAVNKVGYGTEVKGGDHLGALTYQMPTEGPEGFYHADDDIGLTQDEDGRLRISAKIYKQFSDMTTIDIQEYDIEDQEIIKEFKEAYKNHLSEFSDEYGKLPDFIDDIVIATDSVVDEDDGVVVGTYYTAFLTCGDKLYAVRVLNGDDVRYNAETFISSMSIDDTLQPEYREQ